MKTRTFVSILILVLAVMIIGGSYATGQDTAKSLIAPLYGTWENPDYNIIEYFAKVVIKPDGILEQFGNVDLTEGIKGTYSFLDCMIDQEGNKYYKVKKMLPGFGAGQYKVLWKLNENETELESVFEVFDYPTKIDPTHARYRIYYRQ